LRLWLLYLRSRLAFPALALLLLIAGLCWLAGNRWGSQPDLILIASIAIPLAAAIVVCATAGSPFGEIEQSLSRPLAGIRLAHLAWLLLVATVALAIAATAWSGIDVEWRFVRNLLGLAGLALLTVPLVGGRLAWIAPLTLTMTAQLFARSGVSSWTALMWPTTAFENGRALAAALLLLAGGLAAIYLPGPKVTKDEPHG
jgi:hypothetical protein